MNKSNSDESVSVKPCIKPVPEARLYQIATGDGETKNENDEVKYNNYIGHLKDIGVPVMCKRIINHDKVCSNPNGEKGDHYEMVNHPDHYNNYDVEVIDMMIRVWGSRAAADWCLLTAFKYRMRMGLKPDNDIEQDLKKEQWYLDKRKEILELYHIDN